MVPKRPAKILNYWWVEGDYSLSWINDSTQVLLRLELRKRGLQTGVERDFDMSAHSLVNAVGKGSGRQVSLYRTSGHI